jgi:hypothetical protein
MLPPENAAFANLYSVQRSQIIGILATLGMVKGIGRNLLMSTTLRILAYAKSPT